jgi:hypothetical protein
MVDLCLNAAVIQFISGAGGYHRHDRQHRDGGEGRRRLARYFTWHARPTIIA